MTAQSIVESLLKESEGETPLHSPEQRPSPAQYRVQVWDSDCECWEDAEECRDCASRFDAEDEARELKRRCAHPVRTRVVKV